MSNMPLVVTPGEPSGVGAEITLKAWKSGETGLFFLLDDPNRVDERAKLAGLNIPLRTINCPSETKECFPHALPILPHYFPTECAPGKPSVSNAPSIIKAIDIAVDFIDRGFACGIVTNPIQKHTLRESGFKYAGHTEYLANLAGTKTIPVMLLVSSRLRVVPVTIHEPINKIANLVSTDLIVKVCLIAANSLKKDFGIQSPKIWIAGLNPHAGENGAIGLEEKTSITPAVKILQKQGLNVSGPYPADSMFHKSARDNYDVAICMYHDQALIPLKTLDFWGGVNMTAGLPFVRTSPDHGTALDLAGTGKANPESLIKAICLAHEISTSRQQFT